VLWLLAETAQVENNLRAEAKNRGVDPARLIFAPRIAYSDYLARYRLADLFLDTLPFNAGTTASDALWAGLPLITCPGRAFASRMAGSLLTALEMPELIAESMADYEALAARLARDPQLMAAIKMKLERNRARTPLFDTELSTRHLEAAYSAIHQRVRMGLAPDHIRVTRE
jgi:predicted O-linked N-acetylglucosamine transferase (SPINDLY family)